MDNICKGSGEEFSDLLQAARERVNRLRQYTSQPKAQQTEYFESSILELDALLEAIEIAHNSLQDRQKDPNHKIVEKEWKEQQACFRRVYEANLIGIGFGDLEGNILEANDTSLQLF